MSARMDYRARRSWAEFQARVRESGGTVIEPAYLGKDKPHRVLCAVGHEVSPRPKNVRNGTGICRICAGRDPGAAEAAFRARLAEENATLLEPNWLGSGERHKVL